MWEIEKFEKVVICPDLGLATESVKLINWILNNIIDTTLQLVTSTLVVADLDS